MIRVVTLLALVLATLTLALGDRVGEGDVKVTLPGPEWQYEDYGNELYAWWPNPDDPDFDFGSLSVYTFQVSPVSEAEGRADLADTMDALAGLLDKNIQDNYLVIELGDAIRQTEPYLMVGRYYTDEAFGWGDEGEEAQRFYNLDAFYLRGDHVFAANFYTVLDKADEVKGIMLEILSDLELPESEADRYTDGEVADLGGFTVTLGDGPWIAVEDFGSASLTAYDGFDKMANLMLYWVNEPVEGEKTAATLKDELRVFLDEYFTGFEVKYIGDGFAREGESPYAAWAYHVDMGLGEEYHYDAQQIVAGQSYYIEAVVPAAYEARMAPVVVKMAEGTVIAPGAGAYDDLWNLIEGYDEEMPEEPGDGE
ncbi:MAG: hypothetical protein A2Y64_03720 [Candidatus Coatesbacteria bacterium RBG_13_66_14]|uniref:Uncharacterized protein n=1 Tax=Candidatus Coatesbacteria bacterium RBG_13_66_14 TaxID=1817816 RepID=A0A1F5EWM1_9BACT|nr:MAG: hypothetical protein A2Y64_03720 [Candidatus Coatesbacteria bacterium RBG_13_66_14]